MCSTFLCTENIRLSPERAGHSPSDKKFAFFRWRWGCDLSLPKNAAIPINNDKDPAIFSLTGPAALRAHFFPRQRVSIKEAGKIIGVGYHQLWKLSKTGRLKLRIRTCDAGRSYVLLDDLIEYIFSPSKTDAISSTTKTEDQKKKSGRPRKSTSSNGC